jgi:signal transduction histidine kinase/ABC-type uncharacterized transport system substrate-binding protein
LTRRCPDLSFTAYRHTSSLGNSYNMPTLATRLLNICAGAVALMLLTVAQTAAQPKRVMVLHSYGQHSKPWSDSSKALRQELLRQSPWPLDYQDFSLVTARSSDTNAESAFVEYLRALYVPQLPDLIVAVGAPSAGFVQRHRAGLFSTVPMVLTAVDQRRIQQTILTENDAVVAVRFDIPALFNNILQVLPDTKTIIAVIGNSPGERLWLEEMQQELKPVEHRGVQITFYNDRSFEDMLRAAASLPMNTAIYWNQPQIDATGVILEGEEPLKRLYAVANAPIFSHADSFFNGETVGGPMISTAENARRAAAVAVRILAGEKPGDIKEPPLEQSPPRFDWRQLQRWKISESRLPPGSEIYFREPTAWDRYHWQIIAIVAAVLLQAALIAGLLYERHRRRGAETQSLARLSELARVNRHSTASELSSSIAHELNQPLGAILNNAETLDLMLRAPSPDLRGVQDIVHDILRDDKRASDVIQRLRGLLTKKPFELRDIDLNQTVADVLELLSAFARQRGVDFTKALSSTALRVRGDTVQLQQVLVNLIINGMDAMSAKNGGRREIFVRTTSLRGFAEVSVSDSGPGISPDNISTVFDPFFTTKENGMGMGLSIARTIIEAHGGQIRAENRREGGAIFSVDLPLSEN